VVAGSLEEQQPKLEENLRQLTERWTERAVFKARHSSTTNEGFVDALSANARLDLAPAERAAYIDELNSGALTRAQVLLAIVNNRDFVEREQNRSLVLLHYFSYLHRNPDDPPDKNMDGFNFWLKEVETSGEVERLTRAFMASIEHGEKMKK
jgi:hypothetical protein